MTNDPFTEALDEYDQTCAEFDANMCTAADIAEARARVLAMHADLADGCNRWLNESHANGLRAEVAEEALEHLRTVAAKVAGEMRDFSGGRYADKWAERTRDWAAQLEGASNGQ